MAATVYPKANRTAQWFGDTYPGADMGGVDKVLLHTTETGGWPGYGGGASAPHLTYDPRKHEWRQHFRLDRSARALRDPSGTVVRENRDRVVQVEIVCSSDRSFARRYGYPHVTQLDERALRDLGEFIAFMHAEWGVPLRAAARWLPYPDSYGNSPARMSGPEYDAFRGVLGHQHASGNAHGDPGDLDVTRIMAYARGAAGPPEERDWFDMASKADLTAALRDLIPEIADAAAAKVWDRRVANTVTADPSDVTFIRNLIQDAAGSGRLDLDAQRQVMARLDAIEASIAGQAGGTQ